MIVTIVCIPCSYFTYVSQSPTTGVDPISKPKGDIMKFISLSLMLFLSNQASIAAEVRVCEDKAKTIRVMTVSSYDGTPDLISVRLKGKLVIRDLPGVHVGTGSRIEFVSLNYKTSRGAPASLRLLMYPRQGGGNYIGDLSETSYLPDIPATSAMDCVGRIQ